MKNHMIKTEAMVELRQIRLQIKVGWLDFSCWSSQKTKAAMRTVEMERRVMFAPVKRDTGRADLSERTWEIIPKAVLIRRATI